MTNLEFTSIHLFPLFAYLTAWPSAADIPHPRVHQMM